VRERESVCVEGRERHGDRERERERERDTVREKERERERERETDKKNERESKRERVREDVYSNCRGAFHRYRVAKTHRMPQVADHFPQKSH